MHGASDFISIKMLEMLRKGQERMNKAGDLLEVPAYDETLN